jgi:molecular chaperone DnaJ
MRQLDPYVVLGLEREATVEEVKKAYRQMARDLHPDHNADPEATVRFQEIRSAYDMIGSEGKKRSYDALHISPFTSYGTLGASGSGLSSLFKAPPAGQRARPAMRGRDLETEVAIAFEDALNGSTAEVEVEFEELCPDCGGDRSYQDACRVCGGSGLQVTEGDMTSTRLCLRCHGSGMLSCNRCEGAGLVKQQRKHKVKVPAGVDEGTRIRISGKGSPGVSGGQDGDLYVITRVLPSEIYERRGADLILDVPITYPEAVLGGSVVLPTPDGPISLKVPEGSMPGRLLRIRGRGVPKLGEQGRGDLYARIGITLPERLSADEKDLLETLLEVSTETPRAHFFPDGAPDSAVEEDES